jgi:hypothetical protein
MKQFVCQQQRGLFCPFCRGFYFGLLFIIAEISTNPAEFQAKF